MTEFEKALGKRVKSVIDAMPGLEAQFAETVQDFDALGRNVFDAISRCSGAIIVPLDRGLVMNSDSALDGGDVHLSGSTKRWQYWPTVNL